MSVFRPTKLTDVNPGYWRQPNGLKPDAGKLAGAARRDADAGLPTLEAVRTGVMDTPGIQSIRSSCQVVMEHHSRDLMDFCLGSYDVLYRAAAMPAPRPVVETRGRAAREYASASTAYQAHRSAARGVFESMVLRREIVLSSCRQAVAVCAREISTYRGLHLPQHPEGRLLSELWHPAPPELDPSLATLPAIYVRPLLVLELVTPEELNGWILPDPTDD